MFTIGFELNMHPVVRPGGEPAMLSPQIFCILLALICHCTVVRPGGEPAMLSPTGREDKFSPLKSPAKDIEYQEVEEFYVKYKNL